VVLVPVGYGDLLALLLLERPDWQQTSVPENFSFFVCAIVLIVAK